jgi:hypothetical protein
MAAEVKWMAVAIHQKPRDQQAITTSDLELIILEILLEAFVPSLQVSDLGAFNWIPKEVK